jgi:hypothetical protein
VSKERFATFIRHMGDQERFGGNPNRDQITNEIESEAAQLKELNQTSLSAAFDRNNFSYR